MSCRSAAILLLLFALAARPAAADLRDEARQASAGVASPGAAARLDPAAQRRSIEALGGVTMRFLEASDTTTHAGTEKRDREGLRATYDLLAPALESLREATTGEASRRAREVMDEDGDLEALLESEEHRRLQSLGAQALYYLNWLRLYGARWADEASRRPRLEEARRGFSEFIGGDASAELQAESRLGRGLAALELERIDEAARDLREVAATGSVSAEQRDRARLALLDGFVRHGRPAEALRLSEELLRGSPSRDTNTIRFLRIRALLESARKSGAAEASRQRQQAMSLIDTLRAAGGIWEDRANALFATAVEDPARWAASTDSPLARWELARMMLSKGDKAGARPLLEEVVKSEAGAVRSVLPQAHYYLGVTQFEAGDWTAAAASLDSALADAGEADFIPEAAYLRFKAQEALAAKEPETARAPAYESAILEFLERAPNHPWLMEGRFRLGELRQTQGRFEEAIAAFAKVEGDPGFEMRARFASLQCRFELLGREGADQGALLTAIGPELDRFEEAALTFATRRTMVKESSGLTPETVAAMRAKTELMRIVHGNLTQAVTPEVVLETLAGFETRYPEQKDLFPQMARLRLAAALPSGRFEAAAADADRYGDALIADYGPAVVEELAVAFVREGARRSAEPGANEKAQRIALALQDRLPMEGDTSGRLRLTRAKLRENLGDAMGAATLYREVLSLQPGSLPARRGLARLAEAGGDLAAAQSEWNAVREASRPGDAPWYEAHYETARLAHARGDSRAACRQLEQLKPAMPGLSDVDLRGRLDALYQKACR